ncbi:hypothetical protein GGS24DRAFT_515816 [Hypoxylon argillaceum]|nr:hypothetical protein GGS24DRAFT_515816 [Hypoxylon argillaceum]
MMASFQYDPLPFTDTGDVRRSSRDTCQKPPSMTGLYSTVFYAVSIALLSLSSYLLGRYLEKRDIDARWFSPPGKTITVFEYQKAFALPPSNESSLSWDSLFPSGQGFVANPEFSPLPGCLAVYHQLHCLNTLRHGYWAARLGHESTSHALPAHIRHCFDYLRQSIMCHADTNIEPVNSELGGVTGFGSQKRCRDIGKVRQWAEEWKLSWEDGEHLGIIAR